MKDLIVLVADKNIESSVRELLARDRSLGTRAIGAEIYVHPERDPGCRVRSGEFLKPFVSGYERALVIFDREGSGSDLATRADDERAVQDQLDAVGWRDRSAAVVIDPELESWFWSPSPHVDEVLAWRGRSESVRDWLSSRRLWLPDAPKPSRPKEAVERVLRETRKPRSSSIYADLARKVALGRCEDASFERFVSLLRRWFPRATD